MRWFARRVQRILVLGLGVVFILLGIAGLFLPILQGVLFILVGLYLLSRESVIARRWLESLRRRYPKLDRKLRRLRHRRHQTTAEENPNGVD